MELLVERVPNRAFVREVYITTVHCSHPIHIRSIVAISSSECYDGKRTNLLQMNLDLNAPIRFGS